MTAIPIPLIGEADEPGVRLALAGLTFPASRDEVVAHAAASVDALHALPDRVYTGPDDVVISLP